MLQALYVLALLWIGQSSGLAQTVVLDDDIPIYRLGKSLDILEDPTGQLALHQLESWALRNRWAASLQESPTFGFSTSTYWVRFDIQSDSSNLKQRFLHVDHNSLDFIQVIQFDPSGKPSSRIGGDHLPFHQRELQYRNPVFTLDILPNQTNRYYLQIKSEGTVRISLSLWEAKALAEKINKELYGLGIYFGIMLAMVLVNSFVYLSVRDVSYLTYVFYISSLAIMQLCFNGLAYEYFWPNASDWANKSIVFFMGSSVLFLSLFTQTLLNTKAQTPQLHRALSILVWGTGLSTAAFLLFPYIRAGTIWHIFLTGIGVVLWTLTGIASYKKGYPPARFYLLAFTSFILGIVLYGLRALGAVPDTFVTEFGLQIGSALEVTLFSFALANRINAMRKEIHQDQLRLLEEQNKRVLLEKESLQHQKHLADAFARFVPQDFLRLLGKNSILDVKLGDQAHRKMTIMFTDIRDFSSLSEKMSPSENFRFINSYLGVMSPIIRAHKGFIDKYIGDAIMALFDKSADDALDAAITMIEHLRAYNEGQGDNNLPQIKIGIAINTGDLMLGTVGEVNRMDGSVISDSVNLTARLEKLTKKYGVSIIISEKTYGELRAPSMYHLRLLGRMKIKGKREAITIYEVFNADSPDIRNLKQEIRKAFETGVLHYQNQEYDAALSYFNACLKRYPADKASHLYVARCLDEKTHLLTA